MSHKERPKSSLLRNFHIMLMIETFYMLKNGDLHVQLFDNSKFDVATFMLTSQISDSYTNIMIGATS